MVISKYFHIFLTIFALLTVSVSNGQQAIIKVIDQKTGEPVLYAHACFEAIASGVQQHNMTNEKGEVPNEISQRSKLAITFVGYETLFDTLNPGESKTLFLKPDIINMSEVVVTAQYTPQRIDKSIYKIKVLGLQQIEQKGATNLSDLFRDELSIRMTQDGTFGSNMSIRGLGGEHIKFLIDGVPVIGRMDGNIDLGQLNLNNVDHVEMIEGPMSVIYGSNAIAGVINIITKENRNSKVNASIDTYYETVGVYNLSGGASVKKNKSTISLSGGRNFFDGYSEFDTLRSEQWKPKRQYFGEGYYIFDRSNYKFKFTSRYFNELLEGKGNLMYPYNETALDNYFTTERFSNSLDFSSRIGKKRFLTMLGAYSVYKRVRQEYFKDLTTLTENLVMEDTTVFNDLTLRAVMSKSTEKSRFNYQFGIDINTESGEGEKITDQQQEIGDYAAFFSIQYDPTGSLSLQPGVRYIYNTKYQAPFIYSLNVKWLPHENINLRGSYSRGFRAPSLKELYLDFVDVNHNVQGNDELLAENSHNANLVLDYHKELKRKVYGANLDLFYNHVNDLIKLVPLAGSSSPNSAPLYTYVNIGKYISTGSQFELSYNLYPRLSVKMGITETARKYGVDDEFNVASEFLFSTDLNFNCTYSIIKWGTDVSLFYKYTGDYPEFSYDPESEIYYKGYVESYSMMDITIMKSLFKRSLKVSTGLKNIFDVNTLKNTAASGEAHSGNTGSGQITAWGRTLFVSLSYNFNKYQ